MASNRKKIKSNQLLPGMIIHEVSELSFEYATLDSEHLKYVKHHFKGASAIVTTDSGRQEIPVEELKEFDQLAEIVNIPSQLPITKVKEGQGNDFEKRGVLELIVSIPEGVEPGTSDKKVSSGAPLTIGSNEARTLNTKKIAEIKVMMDGLDKATSNRDKASTAVEDMLDSGRSGKFTSGGVEAMVDDILNNGSSHAMKAIAGLRGSDQTYAHCTDMSVILQDCYSDIMDRRGKKVDEKFNRFILLAGFMHDIGKSEVPKDILESTVRFEPDSQEMMLLRNHTTYGAKILADMGMHETIINVAHFHHVKKDSSLFTSYPDTPYESVKPITRLASIVDVYQALIGKRKYKKNWVPGKAVEYLLRLKGSEFDDRMLDQFLQSMGRYPVGTLLKLSTGDLAFVLMIGPKEFPERPIVVPVENSNGEAISHHTAVDLMLEKDITAVEVVDHYEHYNETEDQAYQIFSSIKI